MIVMGELIKGSLSDFRMKIKYQQNKTDESFVLITWLPNKIVRKNYPNPSTWLFRLPTWTHQGSQIFLLYLLNPFVYLKSFKFCFYCSFSHLDFVFYFTNSSTSLLILPPCLNQKIVSNSILILKTHMNQLLNHVILLLQAFCLH